MYRRAGRGRLLLLAFLALSIIVITLDFRSSGEGPLEKAKEISTAIVAPIQRGIATVFRPVGNFFSSVADIANLRAENEELRQRLADLERERTEALSLIDENERLRSFFGLEKSYPSMERLTAQVIARAPANYKWAVVIDRGSRDGIRRDMAVIDADGLVGKVIRVDETTATVLLLIDPQAGASARIEGKDFTGTIRGNGSQQALSMDFVSTEADVQPGDVVVTAAFNGGIFPPNIPIGEVLTVEGEEAALDKEIEVEPAVEFDALDFVQVILESGPQSREGG